MKDRSASPARPRQLPLSPSRAFVIQLREGSEVGKRFAGRAEHLQSAHAVQFQSLDGLLTFIDRILGDLQKKSMGQP